MQSFSEALIQLFWQHPVAQTTGLIAMIMGLGAFAQKRDEKLKLLLSLYCIVMGLHFLLMGSYPGAVSAWISSVRTWFSRNSRSRRLALFFIALTLILVIPRIDSWIYLLPVTGASLGTWALFRETGIRMRFMLMSGTVCWLTHNIAIQSIGGSLIESSFLLMNSATLFRLWKDKKQQQAANGI